MVAFDEIIQIDTKAFKHQTQMVAEGKMVPHADIMVFIVRIPCYELFQDIDLHHGLGMESFLVADQFDSHSMTVMVIKTFQHLTKRALPQYSQHFVAVRQVVTQHNMVVAPIVIVPIVPFLFVAAAAAAIFLLSSSAPFTVGLAHKVDRGILLHFEFFKVGQVGAAFFQALCWSQGLPTLE